MTFKSRAAVEPVSVDIKVGGGQRSNKDFQPHAGVLWRRRTHVGANNDSGLDGFRR